MKQLLLIGIMILVQGCMNQFSNVKPVEEDIWVSISYVRGPINGHPNAKISKEIYNQLISGKINSGWLQLENVHWESGNRLLPQKETGEKWGYSDRAIIRIENINRIIPLSKEAIKQITNHNSEPKTGSTR